MKDHFLLDYHIRSTNTEHFVMTIEDRLVGGLCCNSATCSPVSCYNMQSCVSVDHTTTKYITWRETLQQDAFIPI